MLTITRKEGQAVVIDHGLVVIVVAAIGHGRVKLSIEAPEQMAIHRGEIEDKIQGGIKDVARNPR